MGYLSKFRLGIQFQQFLEKCHRGAITELDCFQLMIDDKILEKLTVNTNTLITRTMSAMTPEKLLDPTNCHVRAVDITGMLDLQISLVHVYKDNLYTVRIRHNCIIQVFN